MFRAAPSTMLCMVPLPRFTGEDSRRHACRGAGWREPPVLKGRSGEAFGPSGSPQQIEEALASPVLRGWSVGSGERSILGVLPVPVAYPYLRPADDSAGAPSHEGGE